MNNIKKNYLKKKSPLTRTQALFLSAELQKEWHREKNGSFAPEQVFSKSGKKVWWVCKQGHEWQAFVYSRSIGKGCPYCSGRVATSEQSLAILNPDLALEWHPSKNGCLKPESVTLKSHKRVWWLCSKGHEWQARIASRSQGIGCPECSGTHDFKYGCLAIACPELAAEWHPRNNGQITPADVTLRSGKTVWWQCREGHEWQARIDNRSRGNGCPYCSGRIVTKLHNLEVINPALADEWHPLKNEILTPQNVAPMSTMKVWWRCKNGHDWQARIADRNKGARCPFCTGRRRL